MPTSSRPKTSVWMERNTLAGLYFRPLFGAEHVYTLRLDEERDSINRNRVTPSYRTARLFGEQVTFARLQDRLDQGHTIRATPLTANFDFAAFREKWGEQTIPLFALDPKGKLRVFSTRETLQPSAGWTVLSLLPPTEPNRGGKDKNQGQGKAA